VRDLCERLEGTEGLLENNGFRRRWNVCDDKRARMPEEESVFQTEAAATLKPREAKFVQTLGTDNRLVSEERRERAGIW